MTHCNDLIDMQSALDRVTDLERTRPLFEIKISEVVRCDVRIKELSVPRVFVRQDQSLLVQFALEIMTEHEENSISAFLFGELSSFAGDELNEANSNNTLVYIAELQLMLHLFPYDKRLKQLSNCFSRSSNAKDASYTKGPWFHPRSFKLSDTGLIFTTENIVGYRLGKRCVLRGQVEYSVGNSKQSEVAILKMSRPRQTAKSLAAHNILESFLLEGGKNNFALATNLFTDIARGLILTRVVSAPTLYSSLQREHGTDKQQSDSLLSAFNRIGCYLRKLQSYKIPDCVNVPTYTGREEKDKLESNLSALESLLPRLNSQSKITLRSALDDLGECQIAEEANTSVLSHRDFYDKQLFIEDDKITLIDYDTLSLSDAMLDVANFLAHITLRTRQGLLTESLSLAAKRSFIEGYVGKEAALNDESLSRLQWWYKASMMRLAALYSLRPKWKHLTEELLTDSKTGCLNEIAIKD